MLMLLTGCTEYSSQPIGNDAWAIQCRGGIRDCYSEANNVCPYGYMVTDRDAYSPGTTVQFAPGLVQVKNSRQVEVIVQCLGPVDCATQSDCDKMAMRCVASQRHPGRSVCANR
jgi:hypothetical protein